MSTCVSEIEPWRQRAARLRRSLAWVCVLPVVFMLPREPGWRSAAAELPTSRMSTKAAPNVLILVGDDHRGGTLGIDGDARNATPRLDALAKRGVRFTHAYCNSPVCTPSRQSFITGRLPHAVGVTLLETPLPQSAITLGGWLGHAGFETAAIGKMHFNGPSHHGFQTRIDTREWAIHLRAHPPKTGDQRRPWLPFQAPASEWLNASCLSGGLPIESMESTFYADKAIDFLKGHHASPFALVVSFYDPHSPFKFPEGWEHRYPPETFKVPAVSDVDRRDQPFVFQQLTPRDVQGIHAAYYTSLAYVDQQIGRVLDALEATGQAENTVVVYLGDNGYMLGEHGRFEKHCFYEPSIRVPLIVSQPGRLPADRKVDDLVELVDLVPTLAELLDLHPPARLHGRSLVPLLKGTPGASGRSVIFSEYLENEEAMVRDTRYKLIVGTGRRTRLDGYMNANPQPGPYERLYDLQTDPEETTDLSGRAELDGVRDRLRNALCDRLITTRDGLPSVPRGISGVEAIRWCLVPRDRARQ